MKTHQKQILFPAKLVDPPSLLNNLLFSESSTAPKQKGTYIRVSNIFVLTTSDRPK